MHLRRMRLGAGLLAVCPGLDLASRQGDGPALVSVCGALGCGVLGFGWVMVWRSGFWLGDWPVNAECWAVFSFLYFFKN